MMGVFVDIPRSYTAIAEWAACLVFIIILRPRFEAQWEKVIGAISGLVVMTAFLVATDDVIIALWVPCMVLAVLLMYIFIIAMCKIRPLDAAYFTMMGFVLAEFTASLSWQLTCYLGEGVFWNRILVLVVFVGFHIVIWMLLKGKMPKDGKMYINSREFWSAFIISIAVFALSNLSFLSIETPFSSSYANEIAIIRTLVDFGGVAILYAHLLQCCEIRIRKELESVESVLQTQYLQYQMSKQSIDMINMKYHDLKHQINVLRQEEDPDKRMDFLDKMEEEIHLYEAQNKTGNKVLDTVLTSKNLACDKLGITFTAVADGKLLDFMDTMDICSIFGNALDNAIECEKKIAESEKRLIHVTVSRQMSFLMIRIENYFEGDLSYRGGSLATTKADKHMHGYGVKSIYYTAEKYGGAVNINHKDNWFELQILIPIEEGA